MQKILVVLIWLLGVVIHFNFFETEKTKWIDNSHPKISYSGAFYYTQKSMRFAYSGCNINFKTNSTKIILNLRDYSLPTSSNYLLVKINFKDTVIQLYNNILKYDVSNLLTDSINAISIYKLTEASIGKIDFLGLEILGNSFIDTLRLSSKKIVWIGNSVTCGYGNEVEILAPPKGNPTTGFHSFNENNYKAWGSIASRNCKAQAIHLCYSGKGLYRNFDGSKHLLIKDFIQKSIPQDNIEINPETVMAPIYVIHAGTNDFGYEGGYPDQLVDSIRFIKGLQSVFRVINLWNPQAEIIVASSNMLSNYYPKNGNKRLKSYLENAIKTFEKSNMKLHIIPLNIQQQPYGENWHPSAIEHQKMAAQIEPLLKQILSKQ